ncbi:MAG: type II toxin-antitoxin system RelE/ParE family toxin [Planctomycetes bacterium]|nr:type II toxin-antitoxin system RelE/ParE family toxin [Planctomycetota bacterium]
MGTPLPVGDRKACQAIGGVSKTWRRLRIGRHRLCGPTVPRFRKYLVFYRVDDDVIDIIRVLHSARDLPTILESES